MMFGLYQEEIDEIIRVISMFPEIESAFIFGSRAKGNFRKGSDVDIVLTGNNADYHTTLNINNILNEDTLMPYHFDVIKYEDINNPDLKKHIQRVGKLIYKRSDKIVVS
jgi:predicted nucleotidyltransferase